MICDVQYGGKITDDFDRTCFRAYGTAWMSSAITDANFRFFDVYGNPFGMEVDASASTSRSSAHRQPRPLRPTRERRHRVPHKADGDGPGTVLDVQPKQEAEAAERRARTSCSPGQGAAGQATTKLNPDGTKTPSSAWGIQAAQYLPPARDRQSAARSVRRQLVAV